MDSSLTGLTCNSTYQLLTAEGFTLLSLCLPSLANLLHLPGAHHLALDVSLLLSLDHGQDGHHAFLVVDKGLALLHAMRLLDTGRLDAVEGWDSQLLLRVHSSLLLLWAVL